MASVGLLGAIIAFTLKSVLELGFVLTPRGIFAVRGVFIQRTIKHV